MDPLTLAAACGLAARSPIFVMPDLQSDCASAVPLSAPAWTGGDSRLIERWTDDIVAASKRFGIPASWIRAIMQAESAGIPSATSPVGAMGLMQIMPGTWAALRSRYSFGTDPYQPHDNIAAGAAYMRELLDRYGAPGFLAAYNAGPGRLDDNLLTGRPLPDDTRRYIERLAPVLAGDPQSDDRPTSPSPILDVMRAQGHAAVHSDSGSSSALFVGLSDKTSTEAERFGGSTSPIVSIGRGAAGSLSTEPPQELFVVLDRHGSGA